MKLTVQFHELTISGPVKAGHLHWDGQKFAASVPYLERIATRPIRPFPPRGGGANKWIDPKQDPEDFMKNLFRAFKSAYFWASKAMIE